MIVADTCLIFNLFNKTELTKQAESILEKDPHWVMPKSWRAEYANVISKIARKKNVDSKEVINLFSQTIEELKNFEIDVEPERALEIALEYKISVYDAHFVYLAKGFNVLMITEDKEVLKKCPYLAKDMHYFLKG